MPPDRILKRRPGGPCQPFFPLTVKTCDSCFTGQSKKSLKIPCQRGASPVQNPRHYFHWRSAEIVSPLFKCPLPHPAVNCAGPLKCGRVHGATSAVKRGYPSVASTAEEGPRRLVPLAEGWLLSRAALPRFLPAPGPRRKPELGTRKEPDQGPSRVVTSRIRRRTNRSSDANTFCDTVAGPKKEFWYEDFTLTEVGNVRGSTKVVCCSHWNRVLPLIVKRGVTYDKNWCL